MRPGTEPAFTGRSHDSEAPGRYHRATCGAELFDSAQNYDSGSGWPSDWEPVRPK